MTSKNRIRLFCSIGTIVPLLIVLIACESNRKSQLNELFIGLEEGIAEEKLSNFKSSEIDSAGKIVGLVYEEVEKAFSYISPDSKLGVYLDSVGSSQEVKVTYLAIAFHFYLNDKEIDIEKIKPVYYRMVEYDWSMYLNKRLKENISIAKMNNFTFNIGDTIRIHLPIQEKFGEKSTFYYGIGWPKSISDLDSVNSLGLTGIILGKDYGEMHPSGKDSADLIFQIKVLNVSKEDVLISGKNIRRSDTMDFHVTSYGQLIDDY
ncbi:MAG: hypothetical protein R3C61_25435 [Bacteroidia bacterium]